MADLNSNNNTLNSILEKVENLPNVQYYWGTLNTDENGEFNLNCGFQPDIIAIKIDEPYYNDNASDYFESIYTAEFVTSQLIRDGMVYSPTGDQYGWPYAYIGIGQESYGASGILGWLNYSWDWTVAEMQFPYVAIKFT